MGSWENSLGLLARRRVDFDDGIGGDWAGSRISFLYANTVPTAGTGMYTEV